MYRSNMKKKTSPKMSHFSVDRRERSVANNNVTVPSLKYLQVDELQKEVVFLQKRVQYLQSVGAVFRQKVSFILRDCARVPQMGQAELQHLYATTMAEVAKAEHDMNQGGPEGAFIGQADGEPAGDMTSLFKALQRTPSAREDVRKAHLICVALQEKNDIKEKEMNLRREHTVLQDKYNELSERHKRVVLQQNMGMTSGNAGVQNAVAAVKDLYESRVRELEENLLRITTENSNLKRELGREDSHTINNKATPAGGDDDDAAAMVAPPSSSSLATNAAVESLVKQNHLLKARLNKLKEDLHSMKQQSVGSTMQMNESLDSLLAKISEQEAQMREKDTLIMQLTSEKRELAKECVTHRTQVDMYVRQLQLFVKDSDVAQLSNARKADHNKGEADSLSSAVEEYLQQIFQKDEVIQSLSQQLRGEKQAHEEKQLEVRALGVQLETFRAKLDALQAQQQQRDVQQTMVRDMHQRLFSAVETIQATQNTAALTMKLDELSAKLRSMETVDLQLRQKEDEIVILKDDLERISEERAELLKALTSISVMFMDFPRSVAEVEHMMVELTEFKAEVERCAQQHAVPDLLRVEGRVELRLLEQNTNRAKGARRSVTRDTDADCHTPQQDRQQYNNANDDDDDAMEKQLEMQLAQIMNVPPLVPLNEFTKNLTIPEPPVSILVGSSPAPVTTSTNDPIFAEFSPDRRGQNSSQNAALGFLSPSGGPGTVQDVHLTFQLFDDQGSGVLTADLLHLCLATLGIQRQLPPQTKQMSEEQFVVFCCGGSMLSD